MSDLLSETEERARRGHEMTCSDPSDEARSTRYSDTLALVAVVREVAALHQPEPRPSFTEASYEMSGTVPGSVRVSNFRARDVTTCKGCHVEWPCPTAAAVQKLGEA